MTRRLLTNEDKNFLSEDREDHRIFVIEWCFLIISGSSVMEEFLERETFWLKSWSLLDADESYIRSASVRLIGLVYENRKLRDILLSSLSLVGNIILQEWVILCYKEGQYYLKRIGNVMIQEWVILCTIMLQG